MPLVQIPDLPLPPSISIDGLGDDLDLLLKLLQALDVGFAQQFPNSIPDIPLLPRPPELPELPSFIPNVTVELPVLPPAPKIPNIAPQIELALKAVSRLSELYCIVK